MIIRAALVKLTNRWGTGAPLPEFVGVHREMRAWMRRYSAPLSFSRKPF